MTLTPIKSIRAKCLDCCCGQRGEVRVCPSGHCALHPYRMGKRPGTPAHTGRVANKTPTLAGDFVAKRNTKEVKEHDESAR